jgi:hypothetical protein
MSSGTEAERFPHFKPCEERRYNMTNAKVNRRMNREHEYESLLNRVLRICSDNERVDWDAADASAEFKAIRNEIAWGLYEIGKGDGDKPPPTKGE